MKPVELYKRLPRKNCGDCRQKACMPFAFAVLKGEADLSECTLLTDSEREDLGASVRKFDWRDDLIASLREDIKKINPVNVAPKIGAEVKGDGLSLRCFGRDVIVGPDGEVESRAGLTPWMRILVLLYIKNGGSEGLSGTWVLHSELRGGMMKVAAFKRECEDPFRELFDRHFERTAAVLDSYGAEHPAGFATEKAWLIYPFPRLPVLILYWPEEDEFESKITIRFDATADICLDVEQLIFLVEEVARDIEASL